MTDPVVAERLPRGDDANFQAVTQIRNTERHADLATVDIGADRATEQSEQCHRHALQRRSP